MSKGQLFIRIWILDDDTGRRKFGSPWFDFDNEKADLDEWIDSNVGNHKWIEQTLYKYRKEDK